MLTAELRACGQSCKIAYIDPSYMVRSVAADTKDSHMCYLLASQVVHGAMHGFTQFSVCLVNNRTVQPPHRTSSTLCVLCSMMLLIQVYVPLADLASKKANEGRVSITGRTWARVRAITKQPPYAVGGAGGGEAM